jgi:ADP-ribose pyrophosphatase
LYLYLALDLQRGEMHLDHDELLSVEEIELDALVDMIMENKLCDAKTVVGVLKTKKYLENL